jgi:COX assembly mitochondrial protein 2
MQQIEALVKCHSDHPIAKFRGICNEQKWALDRCFREEKVIKRKINQEKAKYWQEKFKQKMAEEEEAQAGQT